MVITKKHSEKHSEIHFNSHSAPQSRASPSEEPGHSHVARQPQRRSGSVTIEKSHLDTIALRLQCTSKALIKCLLHLKFQLMECQFVIRSLLTLKNIAIALECLFSPTRLLSNEIHRENHKWQTTFE